MHDLLGAHGGVSGWATALQAGKSPVRFPTMSIGFFINLKLPAALWLWGLLSLRKEYQGYLLESKSGRSVQLTTLPLSCADRLETLGATNSWSPKGLFRPVMGQLYLLFMIYSKVNFYKNGFNHSLIIAIQQERKRASHFRHVILHFTKYHLDLFFSKEC